MWLSKLRKPSVKNTQQLENRKIMIRTNMTTKFSRVRKKTFAVLTAGTLAISASACGVFDGGIGFSIYDSEEVSFGSSSSRFSNSWSEADRMMSQFGFSKKVTKGSKSARLPKSVTLVAPTAETMAGFTEGDPDLTYDVILQPGHFLRTKGATGASGKRVSERTLVAVVTDGIAKELIDQGLSVAVIAADNYERPLNAYVFFVHPRRRGRYALLISTEHGLRR